MRVRRRFRAMGSEVELLLEPEGEDDGAARLDGAEAEFHRLEGLLSRFRPDSQLSRLNRAGSLEVGPELLELVVLALAARRATGGRFDPTVHDALVAAGYDGPFDRIDADARGRPAAPAPCGGGIRIDRVACRVELEPGFRLDLGGIAKGWAADRALAQLLPAGPALVNAGGDVAAGGRAWPIGVRTPGGRMTLELQDGALATSGRDRRHWIRNGRRRHHLIDPATAAPAEGDLLTVTVSAPTAAAAEVLAKAVFLAGTVEAAAAEVDRCGAAAVLVTRAGRSVLAGALA